MQLSLLKATSFCFFLLTSSVTWGQINSFPYFEDFESGDGGWITGGTNSSWELGMPTNNNIDRAFSGSNTWVTSLNSFPNCPEESFLESPLLDFSEFDDDPILNFQAHIVSNNTFSIEVSTDGGSTYSLVGRPSDPNWYDIAQGFRRQEDDFEKFSHKLDNTAGFSAVKIRFVMYVPSTANTEGVAIDDVEINGSNDFIDLAITSIQLPEFSPFLTVSEELTITVQNFGGTTTILEGVHVSIDGPGGTKEFFERLNTSINPMTIQDITLSTVADLSIYGTYSVNVNIEVTNDEVIGNNSLKKSTGKVTVYSDPLPYIEEYTGAFIFERKSIANIPELQSTSFTTESGVLGVLSNKTLTGEAILITSDVSGMTSDLIITLDLSTYDANEDNLRLSAQISTPQVGSSSNNQIFIRGDVEQPWLSLYNWQNEIGKEIDAKGLTLLNLSQVLLHGNQNYGNSFQIRFGAGADDKSVTVFQLDNLVIEETPSIDVAVIGGTIPEISPLLTNSEPLSIKLANYGKTTVNNIPVSASSVIESALRINEKADITLLPGETATYDFVTGGNFSEVGNYNVFLSTDWFVDESPNNNVTLNTGKSDVYSDGLPFLEDFKNASSIVESKNLAVVNGLTSASFLVSSNGLLFVGNSQVYESFSAKINGDDLGSMVDLVFTLDLSSYDANSDQLRLGAKLFSRAPQPSDNNKFFIRGAADKAWITLFDWGTELKSENSFVNLSFSNISQSLLDANQNYGNTFQIRFGGENSNPLEIDDVFVELIPDSDVAVMGAVIPDISPLLSDSETLSIKLINQGLQEITSVQVGYSVTNPDGVKTTVNETANITLAPGEASTYDFTETANFSQVGNYGVDFFIVSGTDGSDLNNKLLSMKTGKIDVYQGDLPFSENFNQADFLPNRGQNIAVIDNIKSATFITGHLNGLFGIRQSDNAQNEEDREAFFGLTSGSKSDLIFTLNLSDKDANSDKIELSVAISNIFSLDLPNNRIFIRGDTKSEWLELFDWSNEIDNDGTQTNAVVRNISETLSLSGQNYGETFQIRFGQEGNGTIKIDNLKIDIANTPPTLINPVPDQELTAGFNNFPVDLSEVFKDENGDPLTLSALTGETSIATVSIAGNTLNIKEAGIGSTNITVIASDGRGGAAADVFSLTVIPGENNSPTVVNPLSDQELIEGFETIDIDLTNTFEDIDGDVLTFGASSGDLDIITTKISDNLLTVSEAGLGSTEITVTADDGKGGTVSDALTVSVSENTPPTISEVVNQVASINRSIMVDFVVSDDEQDNLIVTASSNNQSLVQDSGLILDGTGSERTLTINPLTDALGEATITLTVSDGILSNSTSFTFIVNRNGTITSVIDQSFSYTPIIFPNPTDGEAFIHFSASKTTAVGFQLFDLAGERVELKINKSNETEYIINLNDQTPGVYFLRIKSDGELTTKRIFKE